MTTRLLTSVVALLSAACASFDNPQADFSLDRVGPKPDGTHNVMPSASQQLPALWGSQVLRDQKADSSAAHQAGMQAARQSKAGSSFGAGVAGGGLLGFGAISGRTSLAVLFIPSGSYVAINGLRVRVASDEQDRISSILTDRDTMYQRVFTQAYYGHLKKRRRAGILGGGLFGFVLGGAAFFLLSSD